MRINPAPKKHTFAAELIGSELWFPVRRSGDDGHEFICITEYGADADHAQQVADKTNLDCGKSYGETNPVVRIAKIKLIACEA